MLTLILLLTVAQNVINPTKVEFTASLDHAALQADGQPVLTNYELRILQPDGETPVYPVVNLNKPTPDANKLISVVITDIILNLPSGAYTSKVAAKGPGGENVSELSNTFNVDKDRPMSPQSLSITIKEPEKE